MSIRTIDYCVKTDDTIEPIASQYGGVQGEENATRVEFDVSEIYSSAETNARYRIEITDGAGTFSSTAHLTVGENKVVYSLDSEVTAAGGVAQLFLIKALVDENNDETEIVASYPARVYFVSSANGSGKNKSYHKGLSGLMLEAERQRELAQAAAQAAEDSAEDSQESAVIAENAAQAATDASSQAVESAASAQDSASNAAESAQQSASVASRAQEILDDIENEADVSLSLHGNSGTAHNNIYAHSVPACTKNVAESIFDNRGSSYLYWIAASNSDSTISAYDLVCTVKTDGEFVHTAICNLNGNITTFDNIQMFGTKEEIEQALPNITETNAEGQKVMYWYATEEYYDVNYHIPQGGFIRTTYTPETQTFYHEPLGDVKAATEQAKASRSISNVSLTWHDNHVDSVLFDFGSNDISLTGFDIIDNGTHYYQVKCDAYNLGYTDSWSHCVNTSFVDGYTPIAKITVANNNIQNIDYLPLTQRDVVMKFDEIDTALSGVQTLLEAI